MFRVPKVNSIGLLVILTTLAYGIVAEENAASDKDFLKDMVNFPYATLYSEENFAGDIENYLFNTSNYKGGCHGLTNLKAKVKSVRTFGKCVRLFYGYKCSGWSLAVYPGSGNSQNVLNSKLTQVESVGPCLPEEFQNATLNKGTGTLTVLKEAKDAHKHFPDLVEFHSHEKYRTSKNTSCFSVKRYTQGPKNRLEYIRASVSKRHLYISQPNFDVENSEFYRSLDKRPGDVAGFAIAPSIGGPVNQNFNVFPQTSAARGELTNLARKIRTYKATTNTRRATLFALNLMYEDDLASRPYAIYYWINYGGAGAQIEYGRILN